MKPIPIIALLLSLAALAITLTKNAATSSSSATAAEAGLEQQIAQLQRQVRQLETLRKPSSSGETPAIETLDALAQPAATLATGPNELEALKKSLDPYGVIQATGDRIEDARAKLLDPEASAWERAKGADLLKQYGLFDDEAVAAMHEVLTNSDDPNDTAAALVALKGHVTPAMRDEILAAVNAANAGEKPNPRVTYYGIEALESLLPDPVVREWMIQVAETDPELKIATRAATSIGARIQPEPAPAEKR